MKIIRYDSSLIIVSCLCDYLLVEIEEILAKAIETIFVLFIKEDN